MTQTLAYRVMWERAQSVAMCQVGAVYAARGKDEFAGYCTGYLGEGRFIVEAFYVRFQGEQPVDFVIGERSVLTRKEAPFRQWPATARAGIPQARALLRKLVTSDVEGFLIATPAAEKAICWSEAVADEGVSEKGPVDPRVWLRVTTQLGLTGAVAEEA